MRAAKVPTGGRSVTRRGTGRRPQLSQSTRTIAAWRTMSGGSIASPDDLRALEPLGASDLGARVAGRQGVAEFVRTPFDVRRNVVKLWRPLPHDAWSGLVNPADVKHSKVRERKAVAAVGFMALLIVCGASSVGYRAARSGGMLEFPLLGGTAWADGATEQGWYFSAGQMLGPTLWVVLPSLAGWLFVRGMWIPLAHDRSGISPPNLGEESGVKASDRTELRKPAAAVAFARHLGGTYLYVYAMIMGGTLLMALLMILGPLETATLRWCLWCFLFGESFFVPAVMWSRLVAADAAGEVFGRRRYAVLIVYALLFVIVPIMGMAVENAREAA